MVDASNATDAERDEARAINRLPSLDQRRHALEQIAHKRGQEAADRIKWLAFELWPTGASA